NAPHQNTSSIHIPNTTIAVPRGYKNSALRRLFAENGIILVSTNSLAVGANSTRKSGFTDEIAMDVWTSDSIRANIIKFIPYAHWHIETLGSKAASRRRSEPSRHP